MNKEKLLKKINKDIEEAKHNLLSIQKEMDDYIDYNQRLLEKNCALEYSQNYIRVDMSSYERYVESYNALLYFKFLVEESE